MDSDRETMPNRPARGASEPGAPRCGEAAVRSDADADPWNPSLLDADGAEPLLLPFAGLAGAGARAFVTTRQGGVSAPPHDSLNLGDHVGDRPEAVRENRQRLSAALGLEAERLVFVDQVHGRAVLRVEAGPRFEGAGAATGSALPELAPSPARPSPARPRADALVTDRPGLCLCIMVADCVPVLLYDPATGAVGAAHAGWKGTVGDVAGEAVRTMQAAFGSRPEDMLAAIGPAIGPDDFEVGPEVAEAFREGFPDHHRGLIRAGERDRSLVDLWRANALRLEAAGLDPSRIECMARSTFRETQTFFSHRAEGGRTGRFAAGIFLPAPDGSRRRDGRSVGPGSPLY